MSTNEVEVKTSKSISELIQILLIIAIGVILPYRVNAIMNQKFHPASDVKIFPATMMVPLTLIIILERKKKHENSLHNNMVFNQL